MRPLGPSTPLLYFQPEEMVLEMSIVENDEEDGLSTKLPAGQTLQTQRSPAKPASHEATQDPPGTSGPSFCPGS